METVGISWVSEEGLRDEQSVFGIVAEHAVPEEKAHSPTAVPATLDFLWREIFCGQAEGIADSGSEEQAGEAVSDVFWRGGNHDLAGERSANWLNNVSMSLCLARACTHGWGMEFKL